MFESENEIMQYFSYEHLPEGPLRDVSEAICQVANLLDMTIPNGPEKTVGLRKFLEAKDCLVRASLPKRKKLPPKP